MQMLTADQLSNSYNVKLNAFATDIDVMMVRALQEGRCCSGTTGGWPTSPTTSPTPPSSGTTSRRRRGTARSRAARWLGVPVVTERPALYYRKDLVGDLGGAPQTLDDLLAMSLELADRGNGQFGFVGAGSAPAR